MARPRLTRKRLATLAGTLLAATCACAQMPNKATPKTALRPKLVVMIVVDQMRGDYVDRFRGQWSGGLKRLVDEGAWFREAAYPYAATETCVGHATISTGAFPANHGMVANEWWDRDQKAMVTCTHDPSVKNMAYAGGTTKDGDSAAPMLLPAYAQELKFQSGGPTRVVTFSLKARAAITMAGHKADAVTWFDTGAGCWVTSSAYGMVPFMENYATKHPVGEDYGKTWALSLPESSYLYDEKATGAATVDGWSSTFPHPLRGKEGSSKPDQAYLRQWATSPFADTALTRLAEAAVDSLGLGKGTGTDYLGVSYSSTDYVGHTFGPRSREIQDILVRLDKDLGELLVHLDQKVGKGNYIVALTADHGVAPIPEDMKKTGFEAGVLSVPDLNERMEKALEPFHYPKPAIARIAGNDVYFSSGIYDKLKENPAALRAVVDAATTTPGVAAVYGAEELSKANQTLSQTLTALTLSFFPSRNGDLLVIQKPYWLMDGGAAVHTGTSHGTPYNYDQHVPILFMGYGIRPGEYFEPVTPADIAPTFAALTGITLATRDGHVLGEALEKHGAK
jgi:hypothetical protein